VGGAHPTIGFHRTHTKRFNAILINILTLVDWPPNLVLIYQSQVNFLLDIARFLGLYYINIWYASYSFWRFMVKNLIVTEEIWKEGNMYTSYCPELDVVSCGRSIEEARKNLLEVIQIQLEETARLGTLKEFLENAGYDLDSIESTLQLDKQVIAFDQMKVPIGVL